MMRGFSNHLATFFVNLFSLRVTGEKAFLSLYPCIEHPPNARQDARIGLQYAIHSVSRTKHIYLYVGPSFHKGSLQKKIKSINKVNVLICLDPLPPPPNKEKKIRKFLYYS